MRITYDLLKRNGACKPQRKEFKNLFPDGCEPTVANLTKLANHEYKRQCRCGNPEYEWTEIDFLSVMWLKILLPYDAQIEFENWESQNGALDFRNDHAMEISVAGLSQALLAY